MKKVMLSATLLAVALFTGNAHANFLDDGSFEAATPEGITSNSAWTLAANKPSGNDFSTQFQMAPWSSSDGETGVWYKSFTGDPDGIAATSVLIQSVNAPADGTYSLTFDAARETNFTADEWYVALSSGNNIDSVDLLTAAIPAGNFDAEVTPFSLSISGIDAGSTVNVFAVMTGGINPQLNPQSAMLDNFVLVVPEPTSLALLGLTSLGLLGLRFRR